MIKLVGYGLTSIVVPLQVGQVLVTAGLQPAATVSAGLHVVASAQPLASMFEQTSAGWVMIVLPQFPALVESHLVVEIGKAAGWIHLEIKFEPLVPETIVEPLSQVSVVQVLAAQFGSQTLLPVTPLQVLVVQVPATVQTQSLVPETIAEPLSQVAPVQVLAAQPLSVQTLVPAIHSRLLKQVPVVQVVVAQELSAQTWVPVIQSPRLLAH